MKISFGYECEYFLGDKKTGEILRTVPKRFPRDGRQILVEVRSCWYTSPSHTLESFTKERQKLIKLIGREGLWLVNFDFYKFPDIDETAGFHIHFSADGQIDMPAIINGLDDAFYDLIHQSNREVSQYRMKPHGFEYRSLPATVDPEDVTEFLLEHFVD